MRNSKRKITLYLSLIAALIIFACFMFTGKSFSRDSRDPFNPLISKGGLILIPQEIEVSGLNLGGIIYSEQSSIAIINNEVLKEGDSLGEYTVFKIEEKKVILRTGREEFVLKLEEE